MLRGEHGLKHSEQEWRGTALQQERVEGPRQQQRVVSPVVNHKGTEGTFPSNQRYLTFLYDAFLKEIG